MIVLKHILVPTDFSNTSAIAVRYGVAFAHAFTATLHVLHVEGHRDFEAIVEAQRVVDEAVGAATATVDGGPDVTVQHASHDLLAKVLTPGEERGIHVEYVLRDSGNRGGPDLEIVRYATEQNIDLIIIGTRGHGLLAQLLRGRVGEQVVRMAPCPVLTVHHAEHEFIVPVAAASPLT